MRYIKTVLNQPEINIIDMNYFSLEASTVENSGNFIIYKWKRGMPLQ